jgi:putative hydrolase of the HAD superfamily
LDILLASHANLAILTDGRSVTQRLKLAAVELDFIPLFISEDYQSAKPSPERFVAVEKRWPGCVYVYVADNPVKDFLTPNARGWLTLGAHWIEGRVHRLDSLPLCADFQPRYWLADPVELTYHIKSAQFNR